MPTALITGITGQDGQYMAEFLHDKGYRIYGLLHGQANPKAKIIRDTLPFVELVSGDLQDLSSLIATVESTEPDEVYNFGAISFVGFSFQQPDLTANVTGLGVLRLLEAIRIVGGAGRGNPVRFYQASSSEMFGKVSTSPQNGGDALPSQESLRRLEGVRAPRDRQLPGGLRSVRVQRHLFQPRVPAEGVGIRHS